MKSVFTSALLTFISPQGKRRCIISALNEPPRLTEKDLFKIMGFEAAISEEVVRQFELNANSFIRKQQRRMYLFACSSSPDALEQLSASEPETYREIIKLI